MFRSNNFFTSNTLLGHIEILIDGTVVKRFPVRPVLAQYADGANFYSINSAAPIMHLATGLSNGSHTFTLRMSFQSAGVDMSAAVLTAEQPTIRVMESRR